jgi:hypothetical protein
VAAKAIVMAVAVALQARTRDPEEQRTGRSLPVDDPETSPVVPAALGAAPASGKQSRYRLEHLSSRTGKVSNGRGQVRHATGRRLA